MSLAFKARLFWKTQQLSRTQTNKQARAEEQNKAYLYNSFKHMGERQERYQSIIWGRIDCIL